MNCLLSIDVEDWFQVENLKGAISRDSWETQELRVQSNMDRILSILDQQKVKATFFVLGWVAEKCPALVTRIKEEGHEIASHGYGHELIYQQTKEEFAADLERSVKFLSDLTGEKILGYRAPSFSITDFAIDTLREQGLVYDSSLFLSIKHDRYGRLKKYEAQPQPIFELASGFYEVTLSCLNVLGKNIPFAGGGYFRLFPYWLFKRAIPRIEQRQGVYTFYIHPWEFDFEQPRIRSIKKSYYFRHYNNLKETERRFSDMVQTYKFQPIRNLLPINATT